MCNEDRDKDRDKERMYYTERGELYMKYKLNCECFLINFQVITQFLYLFVLHR